MTAPDLTGAKFLSTGTLGEDTSGYYCWRMDPDDPQQIQVLLLEFHRAEGRWKSGRLASSNLFLEGNDPEAQAKKEIQSNEMFRLKPFQLLEPSVEIADSVNLNVSAGGYDVGVRINGIEVNVRSDMSWSAAFLGISEHPSKYCPVKCGTNEIVAEFRKTNPKSPFPFRIEVTRGSDMLYRFEDNSAKGAAHGSFLA